MTMRTSLSGAIILGMLALAVNSCIDMGEEPSSPLRASSSAVSLPPGGQASVAISGGNPPYAISRSPDVALATASLSGTTLLITASSSATTGGTTSVRVRDTDLHGSASDGPTHEENEVLIQITILPLGSLVANPSSVIVGSSGSPENVEISGGILPYMIDRQPDAALATAQFVNPNVEPAILAITGVTNASVTGSTSVKIKDSSPSPEKEVTIPISKIP
jgi:hypothetical protein